MRPLKLRLSGLRSWRQEQELHFHDVDLAAVVGPTGAGKSSILEAIVYALYNTTTYEGNVKSLISADAGTVSVAFDFEADGEAWRVTRSTSRTGYPPPVHRFACISNPEAYPTIDGRTAVTEAVTRLLGLNVDQFTSAVLLPQGRFQRLLTATDGERTAILKGVFRLDELDETRERAVLLRTLRVQPALDDAIDARGKLMPDPSAELDAARSELKGAVSEVGRLEAISERQRTHVSRALELAGVAERARTSSTAVRTALAAVPSLDNAIAADAELTNRAAGIDRVAAVAARVAARDAVHAAESDGRTIAALSAAQSVIANAAGTLPLHAERSADLARQRGELIASESDLADAHAALAQRRTELEPLRAERDRLAAESAGARDQLDVARERLGQARRAVEADEHAAAEIQTAEQAIEEARTAAEAAKHAAELAQARLEGAEDTYDVTRRSHEAAPVAAGLTPGDECPVCHSTVPTGFVADEPPIALAAAKAAVDSERGAAAAATRIATAAATTLAARDIELNRAQTTKATTLTAAVSALTAAHLAGVLIPAASPNVEAAVATLVAADNSLLAPLFEAAREADVAAGAAAEAFTALTTEITASDRDLARRASELESTAKTLRAAERSLEGEQASLLESISRLPALARPATIGEADLLAAHDVVSGALDEAQRLHDAEDEAVERLTAIDEELETLRSERAIRVEAPRQAAMRRGDALALLVTAPVRPEDVAPLAVHATWLAAVCEAARATMVAQEDEANNAERNARVANDAAVEALAGFDDAAALERSVTHHRALQIGAERRIAKAEEEQPQVQALEGRISALRARRDALEEVTRLLNAGQFVGWLVARRQRHLLTVSSEILAGMTGERYRFAADFSVVDGRSGQPRSARTLSGGESFLASLALALGMAELAARSGGRIGSLFLDEGFGSLDPNALDEAIEALEARARAGQMILVISHVPTVAQRIERVLRVTPSAAGSTAEWLDEADREALLSPMEAA
jgi:exonuclease SbcC